MKIYLIEDYKLKADRILAFLNDSFPGFEVSLFGSYQSGLKAIQAASPDILLLDMTIPTFDKSPLSREGRPRPLGGRDLMHKLIHKKNQTKIIVITQLESFPEGQSQLSLSELSEQCFRLFPNIYYGAVYYSHTSDNWKEELKKNMNNLLGEK